MRVPRQARAHAQREEGLEVPDLRAQRKFSKRKVNSQYGYEVGTRRNATYHRIGVYTRHGEHEPQREAFQESLPVCADLHGNRWNRKDFQRKFKRQRKFKYVVRTPHGDAIQVSRGSFKQVDAHQISRNDAVQPRHADTQHRAPHEEETMQDEDERLFGAQGGDGDAEDGEELPEECGR